ncbi:hypothetical protein BJ741DRAFT_586631 [Chytriomyces cf. hyalinus JEL632]|nr:hypothetical protein BJ741DRAFT_586631 [Chytriomyces cf. hyalinus JEL632]
MDLSPLRNQSSSGKARNSLHKTIPTTATATTSAKRGKKQKQEEFFYAALESALKAQNERAQMQLNLNEKRLAFEKARMEKMREREGAWLEYARRREEIAQKRQELELKREERAQEREDFEQKKREAEQEMHAQLLAWDKKILRLRNESARLDALVERAEARHKLKTIVSKQELDALFPDLAFIGEKN